MVYDSDSLIALHGLTERGEREYRKMLEREADKLLFRAEHPLKWAFEQVIALWRGFRGRIYW